MPAENCTGLSHICCKRSAKHTKTAKISKQEIFILEKLSSRLCFSLTQSVFKLIEMDTKYIEENTRICKMSSKNVSFIGSLFLSIICWEPSWQINQKSKLTQMQMVGAKWWTKQTTQWQKAAHRKWVIWIHGDSFKNGFHHFLVLALNLLRAQGWGHSLVLWRLWLLVVTDRQTKQGTRSPIELFWTAKKTKTNTKKFQEKWYYPSRSLVSDGTSRDSRKWSTEVFW